MYVIITAVWKSGYSCHYETFRIDRHWYWNHAIKFARWQHLAMRRGVGCCILLRLVFYTEAH